MADNPKRDWFDKATLIFVAASSLASAVSAFLVWGQLKEMVSSDPVALAQSDAAVSLSKTASNELVAAQTIASSAAKQATSAATQAAAAQGQVAEMQQAVAAERDQVGASIASLEQSRALRNPVFVVEPRDEAVIVQFRTDEGFRSIPIREQGGPLLQDELPEFRLTNYGGAPAINVLANFSWREPQASLTVPVEYSKELVRGFPRISRTKDGIWTTLEGTSVLGAGLPVSNTGQVAVGSVGPNETQEIRVPPAVTYALYPLMLNDSLKYDARNKAYLAEQLMAPTEPITQHDLQIDIYCDAITGKRFIQTIIVRFTVAFATDRRERTQGSEFGKPSLARIEANDGIKVLKTTFPARTGRRPVS
ncbi:MAG TPA: hypothetical protein VMU37_09120 [Caulobacteraceae bacterium]|nr:hypothetical protein [Caulobacteraceae bacterium]